MVLKQLIIYHEKNRKFYFILLFFLFLFFSCKITVKEKDRFIYNKKLAEIETFEFNEKLFDDSKKVKKLDSLLFNYFKDSIEIIKYPKSNKFLIDFFLKI